MLGVSPAPGARRRSFLFDFANEGGGDAISVQVAEAGVLHFGAGGHSMKVED